MNNIEEEKRLERQARRKVISEWKNVAKTSGNYKQLQKEARHEALLRIEESARTLKDFQNIIYIWDELDRINKWRNDKNVPQSINEILNNEFIENVTIIPPLLGNEWWRQMLKGDFLDVIHDCPYEIHELTSSRLVHDLIKKLDEKRKEVLYYWAIRQWTPQRIAVLRGQSDRNIRKVYNNMIKEIRCKIFKHLYSKYEKFLPLTSTQIIFIEQGIGIYGDGTIRNKESQEKPNDSHYLQNT